MSFLGSIVDAGISAEINRENLAFQQSAIDQNMALTRESWARDDNAIQRRVADLKAAGLNPILAVGSAAGNSNPIRVEPKKSSFNTDFGSSSLADDIGKVQQIKHNSETNKGLVLQNEILDAQKQGILLDNQKKQLEIDHYGETPTVKFVSAIMSHLTGKSFYEWLDYLSGRSSEDPSVPSSTPPQVDLAKMTEDFANEFILAGSENFFEGAGGTVFFTKAGQKAIDDFYNQNLSGKMSKQDFISALMKACKVTGISPVAAGAGYAGGGGYAW